MDPSKYADLFRAESREQLTAINRALLAIEQGESSREPVDAIFRGVHTVKGMSATMGYTAVAEFSHELESLLDRVREGEQGITPELMDALFAAADALEAGIEDAQEDVAMGPEMRKALERLQDVAGGRSTSAFKVARKGKGKGAKGGKAPAAPALPSVETLDGPGILVRIQQDDRIVLPGVRAFMTIQKLRELGDVVATAPPVEQLQAATTPQAFRVLLSTNAGESEIERAVLSVGDVASVEVERREPGTAPHAASASVVGSTHDAAPRNRRITDQLGLDALGRPAEAAGAAPQRARHVRIELSRLDALLNLIGELVIVRGRLQVLTKEVGGAALDDSMAVATRLISDLQTEIMTSRLVPVGQVFDRFPRLVRDVARQLGKDVLFSVEGKEIELDRSVLDEIGEPVVHLLRNSVDHGLESPAQREKAGKPRAGRLTLSAQRDRAAVLISVQDDGKGIDRAKVLARALDLGLVEAGTARLDDDTLLKVIAHAGFSTAEQVTDVSGRGVGIDAVQARTRILGGSLAVRTEAGQGTTLTIRLPVTLAIVRALLARVGTERYALPLTHVRETMERAPSRIKRMQGKDMLLFGEEVLPILRLREVVQVAEGEGVEEEEIVVIERGDRRAGLVVDELVGQEDIVVKSFDAVRDGLPIFSGATILADGAPALIVDVGSLL